MDLPSKVTPDGDWKRRGKSTEIISFLILTAPLSHREEPKEAVKAESCVLMLTPQKQVTK